MAGDMPIDNETLDVTQIQSPQLSSLEVILKIECLYVYRSGCVSTSDFLFHAMLFR
jgi:hypothetical protein